MSTLYEYPVWVVCKTNLIELITSKEFIEAIVTGIYKEEFDDDWEIIPISFYELDTTVSQAIAIRDNTLHDFITKILWNQN